MKMMYEMPKQTATSPNNVVMWGQIKARLWLIAKGVARIPSA
jgi:hypothetical protein